MSRLRWARFFWDDWATDNALSLCSLAAQGLWMRLLCIAAQGDDYGSITIGGSTPSDGELAKLIKPRCDLVRLRRLLAELERNKVVRRDPNGVLFSSRMRRELVEFESQSRKGKASAQARGFNDLGNGGFEPDASPASNQTPPPPVQESPPAPRKRGAARAAGHTNGLEKTRNGFSASANADMQQEWLDASATDARAHYPKVVAIAGRAHRG